MTRCSKVTDKQGNSVAFSGVSGGSAVLSEIVDVSQIDWHIIGTQEYCEEIGLEDFSLWAVSKQLVDSFQLFDTADLQLSITLIEADSISLTDRDVATIYLLDSDSLNVAESTTLTAGYGGMGYGRLGYGGKRIK